MPKWNPNVRSGSIKDRFQFKEPELEHRVIDLDESTLLEEVRSLDANQRKLAYEFVIAIKRSQKLEAAPELYDDRADKKESAPDFIQRVYGKMGLLDGNFTRADLRRLDRKAYVALHNWEQHKGRTCSLNLPTKSAMLDRELANIGAIETPDSVRRHNRTRMALSRRTE